MNNNNSNTSARVDKVMSELSPGSRLSVSVNGTAVNGGVDLTYIGMDGDRYLFKLTNGKQADIYEHATEGWKYSDPMIGSGVISHINGINLQKKSNNGNRKPTSRYGGGGGYNSNYRRSRKQRRTRRRRSTRKN